MSLCISDCEIGTIVDHTWERREDGKRVLRAVRRCGIILRVEGNGTDSVSAVWVKFKPGAEAERVDTGELVRRYPASSRPARKALRKEMGQPETVGAEFQERRAPIRPKVEDLLLLRAKRPQAVVAPEGEDEEDDSE